MVSSGFEWKYWETFSNLSWISLLFASLVVLEVFLGDCWGFRASKIIIFDHKRVDGEFDCDIY